MRIKKMGLLAKVVVGSVAAVVIGKVLEKTGVLEKVTVVGVGIADKVLTKVYGLKGDDNE